MKVIICDPPGAVAVTVYVDWGDGPKLVYSCPTGILAAYQEAIDRNREYCDRQVNDFVKRYPAGTEMVRITDVEALA